MGQETSQIDPNTPCETLSSRTLDAVAEYIKGGRPKRIVVMTGAGISTSAGIPDFRSPDTGLYANLARLDLPYAEAVFSIDYFRRNPNPFYILAKELYPGQFYPTVAHAFIALLEVKNLLQMLFTQNIDCLERRAGVPGEKIIEAHGSFATQRCIDCKTDFPEDLMLKAVHNGDVPHCLVPQCNGLVKPDIVFFGEALPGAFFRNQHVPAMADLIIVMGTSLSVQPFASLPQMAREGVPRVLFNLESVGDFGSRADDVVVVGDCDSGVRKLADALGWRDELEELWKDVGGNTKEKEAAKLEEDKRRMTKDELLEYEIEKLTGEVDKTLSLSKEHSKQVNGLLESESGESSRSLKTSEITKSELKKPALEENTSLTAEKTTTELSAQERTGALFDDQFDEGHLSKDLALARQEIDVYAQKRFVGTMQNYMEGILSQVNAGVSAEILTPEGYLMNRRKTVGIQVYFALFEYGYGLNMPAYVFAHPAIQILKNLTLDLVGLLNDIASYKKEQLKGETHNIIAIFSTEGGSKQSAFDRTDELYKACFKQWYIAQSELPIWGEETDRKVQKYVECIQNIVRGTLYHTFNCDRYFGKEKEVNKWGWTTRNGGGATSQRLRESKSVSSEKDYKIRYALILVIVRHLLMCEVWLQSYIIQASIMHLQNTEIYLVSKTRLVTSPYVEASKSK
ncbi:hypothetical protein B7494_g3089 [Chlorociboria aeruginascens]|nr:hypothetical protein B7494_g3089 [Chlorociboria aeruginascens]